MSNIQIKGIDSAFSQAVLEELQYLKQHFDSVLISSDQILIENLIQETELLLEQVKDDSKTYQEKYEILNQLTESWFNVWEQYKDISGAIDLIRSIDHLSNYFIAYSYLCLSLTLINEGKVGEYETDLQRTVSGFLLLSQVVDVFISFFSVLELEQIYVGAKNALTSSTRDVMTYFEHGLELSQLVTQLRAYSSLVVLRIEQNFQEIGATLEAETTQSKTENNSFSNSNWDHDLLHTVFTKSADGYALSGVPEQETHSQLKRRNLSRLRGIAKSSAVIDEVDTQGNYVAYLTKKYQ